MKLLFAAAEIYPYAKTGGLADVAQALPKALSESIEVYSVMPLYRFIDRKKFKISSLGKHFFVTLGKKRHRVSLYRGYNQGIETLFVYEQTLCGRPAPYGDENGDYPDNDIRFGIFSKALVRIAQIYGVDILHLNDWHTALAALWARESLPYFRTVFTIHNLAFQGLFPRESLERLGLPLTCFASEGIEFWGQINCMKAGIAYSDIVTTVSPRYAQEILHPDFGCGLDGFLRSHHHKLYGILNGIDTVLFDPEHDPALPEHYSTKSLQGKRTNKALFCRSHHFRNEEAPLFIFIGRFTEQKGLHLIIEAIHSLLKKEINLAILGEGDPSMASRLEEIAERYTNLSLYFGYDESISHQMYAAADFLLMPSSFEPCGLNQLIALRYGTIPIVHRVGGIYNTIRDMDDPSSKICGRGIAMHTFNASGLTETVERALLLHTAPDLLEETAKNNMQCEVSFQKSAEAYLERYREIL
jgi:starch synthase